MSVPGKKPSTYRNDFRSNWFQANGYSYLSFCLGFGLFVVTMHSRLELVLALATVLCAAYADHRPGWVGKWESIDGREENFRELMVAITGKPITEDEAKATALHEITEDGDHYTHKISVPVMPDYQNIYSFKLNEEGRHTLHGIEFVFKYFEEGNKLVGEVRVNGNEVREWSDVKGDEMEKSYKIGDIHAKRWFKRQRN